MWLTRARSYSTRAVLFVSSLLGTDEHGDLLLLHILGILTGYGHVFMDSDHQPPPPFSRVN